MDISKQNRQLVRIAGGINLLLILLSLAFILFFGYDHKTLTAITRKTVTFMLANGVCWAVNLFLLIRFVPLAAKRKCPRWLSFYLPSYILNFSLSLLISHSFIYRLISDDPMQAPVAGPLFFVISINTLSLVAIELVLSRYAASNIRMENARMKMENSDLKMKSLQAQHEKLKHQLHPHFLFNSLTALKSLIRKDPHLAENYLVKLSEFLRFSISHNEQNVVPLKEELKFSLYYLEMQKIRFRNALVYTVDVPDDQLTNASLPVFSLQLALENAIKHNRLTQEQPLCIVIRYLEPDWLLVENNVYEKLNADPGAGIGLKNLSDRYKLLIQEDIKVDNDSGFFRLFLKIIRE